MPQMLLHSAQVAAGSPQELYAARMPKCMRVKLGEPSGGGWAQVSMPRILALTALSSLAIRRWEGLTVVGYAVNAAAPFPTTPSYSYRLARSLQAPLGLASAFARVSEPVTIIVGSSDEQMLPDRYAPLVQARGNKVTVTIVPGSTHIGMITDTLAVAAVIDRVQHMP